MQEVQLDRAIGRRRYPLTCPFREREGVAGGRKLRVSCGPIATFNSSKQEAKGGSDEAQDSIVLSMSNELLCLVPVTYTHHRPPAAHVCKLGTHHVKCHAHSGQQEALGGFGQSPCNHAGHSSITSASQQTVPWELLLDSWPPHQSASHKCNMR
jgi:hypothetical protein